MSCMHKLNTTFSHVAPTHFYIFLHLNPLSQKLPRVYGSLLDCNRQLLTMKWLDDDWRWRILSLSWINVDAWINQQQFVNSLPLALIIIRSFPPSQVPYKKKLNSWEIWWKGNKKLPTSFPLQHQKKKKDLLNFTHNNSHSTTCTSPPIIPAFPKMANCGKWEKFSLFLRLEKNTRKRGTMLLSVEESGTGNLYIYVSINRRCKDIKHRIISRSCSNSKFIDLAYSNTMKVPYTHFKSNIIMWNETIYNLENLLTYQQNKKQKKREQWTDQFELVPPCHFFLLSKV